MGSLSISEFIAWPVRKSTKGEIKGGRHLGVSATERRENLEIEPKTMQVQLNILMVISVMGFLVFFGFLFSVTVLNERKKGSIWKR